MNNDNKNNPAKGKVAYFLGEFIKGFGWTCKIIIATALVWSALWPLLFKVIPYFLTKFVDDTKYFLFEISPFAFYSIFFLVIIFSVYKAFPLVMYIVNVLVALAANEGQLQSGGINTMTKDALKKTNEARKKALSPLITAIVSALLALSTLDDGLKNIQLKNDIDNLKSEVQLLKKGQE